MEPVTTGALIGLAGTAGTQVDQSVKSKKQFKRTKELMDIQQKNQGKLNEQGLAIGKDMWDYTNYGNQVKHLKEAGLNAGLIYGKGGSGGTTTSPSGGSASSGQAPQERPMDIQNVISAQLAQSQIAVNEAQAKKLTADAEKTSGVDTTKTRGEIGSLEIANMINKIKADFEKGTKYSEEQKRRENENLVSESRQRYNESWKANAERNIREMEESILHGTADEKVRQQQLITEGQEIGNQWARAGLGNSTAEYKLAYKSLLDRGMNEEEVTTVLLAAGVTTEVLKTIVPAGIVGKILTKKPSSKK